MRCASLAEEMLDRGWHVEFCADSDSVPLAGERLAEIGCDVRPGFTPVSAHIWRGLKSARLWHRCSTRTSLIPTYRGAVTAAIPTLTFIDGSTVGNRHRICRPELRCGAQLGPLEGRQVRRPSARAGGSYMPYFRAGRVRRLRPTNHRGQGRRVDRAVGVVRAGGAWEAWKNTRGRLQGGHAGQEKPARVGVEHTQI